MYTRTDSGNTLTMIRSKCQPSSGGRHWDAAFGCSQVTRHDPCTCQGTCLLKIPPTCSGQYSTWGGQCKASTAHISTDIQQNKMTYTFRHQCHHCDGYLMPYYSIIALEYGEQVFEPHRKWLSTCTEVLLIVKNLQVLAIFTYILWTDYNTYIQLPIGATPLWHVAPWK
jgi:hypothetical protein